MIPRAEFFRPIAIFLGCSLLLLSVIWPVWTHSRLRIEERTIRIDDNVRRYRLAIGQDTLPDSPIVIAFHGALSDPGAFAESSGLDRVAAENGWLLVYPQARRGFWSVVGSNAMNPQRNRDIRFFDALIGTLQREFGNQRPIVLIGMSNGGEFAQLLAITRLFEISCVVSHSGSIPSDCPNGSLSMPVLLVVGDRDTPALISDMRDSVLELRNRGSAVRLMIVPGVGHRWANAKNAEIRDFVSVSIQQ